MNCMQVVASSIRVSSATERTRFALIAWFCLEGSDMNLR